MRHASLFRSLVLALIVGSLSAAEPVATLTLEQALASVEKVNLNVLLSRESVVQALEQTSVARSGVLPNITGSLQQRRSKAVPLTNTGATSPRPTNRFDALLNGSVSLFDLQRWAAARSAQMGAEIAEADYNAVLQSVLAGVAQSYFAHLRNLRRLEVLDANIARARTLLDLARNQLAAGVATQIDVTRAEALLAQAEQARLQQVTTDLQSELLLKRSIDLPVASELRLENFQMRRVDGTLTIFTGEKTMFEKRADYLRTQKAVEQSKVDVRTATLERFPTVVLGGTYGRGAANYDDEKQPEWSITGSLSVPIFDGFRAGADRRIALSRQRSQETRLRNLELQISSEVRLAVQDAGSRNAQIDVAEKGLRLAQEELRLAQQRYQQGVADNREVVEAQNRLVVADDNLVEAVFQYNLSRVELARAKGDVRVVLTEKVP
jgi:outer membrane protein TolC